MAGKHNRLKIKTYTLVTKDCLFTVQDAYPSSPKAMHFLNMPAFMKNIFEVMSSFAKDKMRKRFVVHPKGDFSKLHEDVGLEILPAEFGGTNGAIQDHIGNIKACHSLVQTKFHSKFIIADALKVHLKDKRKFLLEMSKCKANEKKRPGKSKTHSELFGMEGSFRQLDFD